jgi:predicted metal-dependent HD superfamily phosphohydrolase
MSKRIASHEPLRLLQVTDEDLSFLRHNWQDLASRYASDNAQAENLFATLCKMYSAKNRFYHNLHHVVEMIRLIDSFGDLIKDRDRLYFATWFHDAVYNSKSNSNEEKSAALAGKELTKLFVPVDSVKAVQDLILKTKTHDPDGNDQAGDSSLFLDADLSILGASSELYSQYSGAIRKEYSWVPNLLYRSGRRKVLKGFLKKSRIYSTKPMIDRFEDNARANMTLELQSL